MPNHKRFVRDPKDSAIWKPEIFKCGVQSVFKEECVKSGASGKLGDIRFGAVITVTDPSKRMQGQIEMEIDASDIEEAFFRLPGVIAEGKAVVEKAFEDQKRSVQRAVLDPRSIQNPKGQNGPGSGSLYRG